MSIEIPRKVALLTLFILITLPTIVLAPEQKPLGGLGGIGGGDYAIKSFEKRMSKLGPSGRSHH